jgi:hypothetical protein
MAIGLKSNGDGITGAIQVNGVDVVGIGAGGITSGAVTAAGVETLSNKTLVDPILTLGAGEGTAGQVPVSQGAGLAPVWANTASATFEEFTTSGNWTKPAGAQFVMVEAWGAGGGGGGGSRQASTSDRAGGGGGGGGAYVSKVFKASELPSSPTQIAIAIGLGGAGGVAASADNTNGNAGTMGGNTTFGTFLTAHRGAGAAGGTTADILGGGGGGTQAASSGGNGGAPRLAAASQGAQAFGGGDSVAGSAGQPSGYGGGGGGTGAPVGTIRIGGASTWGGAGGNGGSGIPANGNGYVDSIAGRSGYFGLGGTGGRSYRAEVLVFNGATYGNSTFVQASLAPYIATSSDGTTWTLALSPQFSRVLWDGTQWLGYNGSVLYTSSDLVNWTQQATISSGFVAIAHSGGTYVAVGVLGAIRTSTDLVNWTSRTSGTAQQLDDVIHDGTRWVAVGANGVSLTSTNSVDWTLVTTASSGNWSRVASSGSVLVATSTATPYAWRSTNNGASWTAVATTLTTTFFGAVIYAGGQWVIAGGSDVWTSSDGNTWTQRTDGTADSYSSIAYSGTTYFISSSSNNANAGISSTNGTSWTARTFTTYTAAGEAGGNGAIACGGGGGGASTNGFASGAGGNGGDGLVRIYTW